MGTVPWVFTGKAVLQFKEHWTWSLENWVGLPEVSLLEHEPQLVSLYTGKTISYPQSGCEGEIRKGACEGFTCYKHIQIQGIITAIYNNSRV